MKAMVLYDLAAPSYVSPEDEDVMALVNRGRGEDTRLLVLCGGSMYLVPRPKIWSLRALLKKYIGGFLNVRIKNRRRDVPRR